MKLKNTLLAFRHKFPLMFVLVLVIGVHYSHLTEDQAQNEVDRMNDHCTQSGHPAVYWCEDHHPDAIYVIG